MAVERTLRREQTFEFTDTDRHLFHEGTHYRLFDKLGAHLRDRNEAHFAVWAPNAERVSLVADFNHWNPDAHPLTRGPSGIWTGVVPKVREAALYKYRVVPQGSGPAFDKADPFGFFHQPAPATCSQVWDLRYEWHDHAWMRLRGERTRIDRPLSIYEVHLGSWMRVPEEANRFLTYRELAPKLAEYAERMGFTHVELLPITEHPFYPSWGYQTTGYFAPTGRYGTPQDLMFLIEHLHQHGIGVFLDWVPSHFATDEHGLALFDGSPLYEPEDPEARKHREWLTGLFDYRRPEVRSFLISSALFWLEKYHADGLRVDAVASMLNASPTTQPPGSGNAAAVAFLRQLNTAVHRTFPDAQMIAEESAAFPKVSHPVESGGLGFDYKWDMGFAHDLLQHLERDPGFRKKHFDELTFRGMYAFSENFILPCSHDDVTQRRGSLLSRLPGDPWRKRATLRLLLAYMFLQPGKKLLFMGNEFGQWQPWNHDTSLDWHLAHLSEHAGIQRLVAHLNALHYHEPALHEGDCQTEGFEWLDCHDAEHGVISWLRWDHDFRDICLCVFNFTPNVYRNFRLGAPRGGFWQEVANTDAHEYGGSGQGNLGGVHANPFSWHGRPQSIVITVPPLAGLALKHGEGL